MFHNQRGNRVERVEAQMRIELIPQRTELHFRSHRLGAQCPLPLALLLLLQRQVVLEQALGSMKPLPQKAQNQSNVARLALPNRDD